MLSITRPVVRPFDPSATLSAGLLAGAAFLGVLMAFSAEPWWMPLNREASIALGDPQAVATFSFPVLLLGLAVHFGWAMAITTIVDSFVRFWRLGPAIAAGAAIGLVLYFVDAVTLTAIAPWIAPANGVPMIGAHVVGGMLAAGAYEGLEEEHARRELEAHA